MTTSRHNYFSHKVFQDTDFLIGRAQQVLGEIDFDTFVVTGDSGLAAGAILSYMMNKNLLVIRKEGVDCHDNRSSYGDMGTKWIFLDDLVDSGATEQRVLSYVYDHITDLTEILETRCSVDWCPADDFCWRHDPIHEYGEPPEYIGTYEYASWCSKTGDFGKWRVAP